MSSASLAQSDDTARLVQRSSAASRDVRDVLDRKFAAASALSVQWAPHRWMTDIAGSLGSRKLCQVRMVGSHDAGTFGISSQSSFGPDAPGVLRDGANWWKGWLQWAARPITHGWARTQSLSILQQLLVGSRYLDIRVAPNVHDRGRFYVTHSLMSVPFADVVRDICSFYTDGLGGEKEIVTLDIQKVLGFDTSDEAACRAFFHELKPLEGLMFPSTLGPSCRMEKIWRTPFRVLCCIGLDCAYAPDYVHMRPAVLKSPWHNSNTAHNLMNSLMGELQNELGRAAASPPSSSLSSPTTQRSATLDITTPTTTSSGSFPTPSSPCDDRGSLYITQAVMSPFAGDIIRGVTSVLHQTPRTIKDYAERINSIALRWFRDVNLCPSSRNDILAQAVHALGEVAHHELGLVWDDDVTNTHGNVLLLDYIEEGSCEWFFASASGSDPLGVRRAVQRTPVKKRRRGTSTEDSSDSTLTMSLEMLPKNSPPSEDAVHVSAVHLCVLINLIQSAQFLERVDGA